MLVGFLLQQMNRFTHLVDFVILSIMLTSPNYDLNIVLCPVVLIILHVLWQSVATFFSHVMAAIGGNTAGPGMSVLSV